jgi:hypothetical protein
MRNEAGEELHYFTLVSKTGYRTKFLWCRHVDRYDGPYLVNDAAAPYVVDLKTGICRGVEGCSGQTLFIVPNAFKRLRKLLDKSVDTSTPKENRLEIQKQLMNSSLT